MKSFTRLSLSLAVAAAVSQAAWAGEIKLVELGTYKTGIFDESAAEIVAYGKASKKAFVVNGHETAIDMLDISDPKKPKKTGAISVEHLSENGKWKMGIQAVDVKNGVVAIAISREYPKTEEYGKNRHHQGLVGLYGTDGKFIKAVEVGHLPDNLKFNNDGSLLVVANEGEPSKMYNHNPEGSVSIIKTSNPAKAEANTLGFGDFDKNELLKNGVKLQKDVPAAQDIEPEYVAISEDSKYAFVALQENNAIALIDLEKEKITKVMSLGFKDHSKPENALDVSNKDKKINITTWPVLGMYQPDSIDSYTVGGKHYIVGANEGDAKDYDKYSEEARVGKVKLDPKAFPNAKELQEKKNLGRLKITTEMGDTDGDGDFDKLYAYGGRSFSIWDMDGSLVYDSGSDFEKMMAEKYPKMFNTTNDENKFDNRSDDKGPEPEALDLGEIDGQWYAFIGLERMGGIMTYNISDPKKPQFIEYVNNRNYDAKDLKAAVQNGTSGDLAPEGIRFVPASDSPNGKPMLIVASEVSGTTTLYAIEK